MLNLGDAWNARYCCSYEFGQYEPVLLRVWLPSDRLTISWDEPYISESEPHSRTFPGFQPSSFTCSVMRHVESCFGIRMPAKSRRPNWGLPTKISANLRSSQSASIPVSIQLLGRDVGLVPFFTKRLGINMRKKDLTAKAIRKKEARIHIQLVCIRVTDFSQSESAPIGQHPQRAACYTYWLSLLDKAHLLSGFAEALLGSVLCLVHSFPICLLGTQRQHRKAHRGSGWGLTGADTMEQVPITLMSPRAWGDESIQLAQLWEQEPDLLQPFIVTILCRCLNGAQNAFDEWINPPESIRVSDTV